MWARVVVRDLHEERVVAQLVGDAGQAAGGIQVVGLLAEGGLKVLLGFMEIALGLCGLGEPELDGNVVGRVLRGLLQREERVVGLAGVEQKHAIEDSHLGIGAVGLHEVVRDLGSRVEVLLLEKNVRVGDLEAERWWDAWRRGRRRW